MLPVTVQHKEGGAVTLKCEWPLVPEEFGYIEGVFVE